MSWVSIKDDREKYKAYLCSREWSLLRNAVRARCEGKCERCKVNQMECVHHLTYARKYDERIEDLAGWCNACHQFTHGKSDIDPAITTSWSDFVARYGDRIDLLSREFLLSAIDRAISCGASHGGIYLAMNLGQAVNRRMGLEWLLDAADGKFSSGGSVAVDDLRELIARRRKEQGIA